MGAGPDPGSGSRGNVSHTYSGRQRNKNNTKNAESMSNQIRCGRNASRNNHNCNNKIDSQGIIFGETVQLVNQMKIFGLQILQAFSGKQIEYKNSDVNKNAHLSVARCQVVPWLLRLEEEKPTQPLPDSMTTSWG